MDKIDFRIKDQLFSDKIIIVLAAALILLNLIIAVNIYEKRLNLSKNQIIASGGRIQSVFNNELKMREHFIKVLQSTAEFYLEDKILLNEEIQDHFKLFPSLNGYILGGVPGYETSDMGNLTGVGPIPEEGSIAYKEISMAIGLSPIFRVLIGEDPETPWVYYTSLNGFIYIYPHITPQEFFFTERLFSKEFIMGALPANNPEREVFWSSVYLDEAGKGLMTTISAPIYNDDRLLGSVSIDLHVEKMKWLLNSYQINSTSNYLINSKGEDILSKNGTNHNIKPENLSKGTFYSYGDDWIIIYDLEKQGWHILLKIEKSAIILHSVTETLPVFFVLLLFSGAIILVVFLTGALKKIRVLSTRDALTGLYNRRMFSNLTERFFAFAKRENTTFGLLIIDIDYFKNFNDIYGHLDGDKALKKVADCLNAKFERETDHVFRIGGEEFAVLCLNKTEAQLSNLMEMLRESIASLKIPHQASSKGVMTISLGGYIVNCKLNNSFDEAFQKADNVLYRSKTSGRNQYHLYRE